VQSVSEGGQATSRLIIRMVWLGFVAYTWIAPGLWKRMLQRDFASVTLKRDD
jgi:hypothetical protein